MDSIFKGHDEEVYKKAFREEVKKFTNRKDFKQNVQNIHTPFDLCYKQIKTLEKEISFFDKDILTFNIEYIEILIYDFKVKREKIWFLTDCKEKKALLNHDRYKGVNVKIFEIDSIKEGINIMGKQFDIIVGNPPYQGAQTAKGKRGGGSSLWDKFVKLSIEELCKEDGYICMVHPAKWRKPEHALWEIMSSKNIKYLEIHDTKDGKDTFGAGTRYDWYVMQNSLNKGKTKIVDENGKKHIINLKKFGFLSNYNFNLVEKMLVKNDEEKCEVIFSYSNYETRKDWMNEEKIGKFKYPCIHATNKKKIAYWYSCINDSAKNNKNGKESFGVPKVIFGDSGINKSSIIDMDGKYGMTQHAMAIEVDTKKEAVNVKKALDSDKFTNLLKTCLWSNFQIDYRIFKYFRKDFWKDFV